MLTAKRPVYLAAVNPLWKGTNLVGSFSMHISLLLVMAVLVKVSIIPKVQNLLLPLALLVLVYFLSQCGVTTVTAEKPF